MYRLLDSKFHTIGFSDGLEIPENASYMSTYQYKNEHIEHWKKTKSVAGIVGLETNHLWWDIDSIDLDASLTSVNTLIKKLKTHSFNNNEISVRFSGSKGFHVVVETTKTLKSDQVKHLCMSLAKGIDGIDETLYDDSQVLRLPNTVNNKSGLFCIHIPTTEVGMLNMTTIKKRAESKQPVLNSVVSKVEIVAPETKVKESMPNQKVKTEIVRDFDISSIDFTKKPKHLDNARWALQNGYFYGSENKTPGDRTNAMLCLAATYKNLGYEKEHTYRLLKGVAEIQAERAGESRFSDEKIWNEIVVGSVYGPFWRNGQFSIHDKNGWLYKYATEYKVPIESQSDDVKNYGIVEIKDGFNIFKEYAKDIDKNTLKFGLKELDEKLNVQVGRLYALLASPGVGKTSFALQLLNNASLQGEQGMFFSYDMSLTDVYEKLVRKHTRYQSKTIYNAFKHQQEDKSTEFYNAFESNYKNISFVFETGQTLEEMRKAIELREEQLGQKIRFIVVDYLELIQSQFSDPTQSSMESIQGLRDIAISMNKAVLVLLQPNKMNSTPDEPLTSYNAAKGSSSIGQSVTAMLTAYRPGYSPLTPEHDNFISLLCVKNRSGTLFNCDFSWDGLTGNISQLEDNQRVELMLLRKQKEDEKNNKNNKGDW